MFQSNVSDSSQYNKKILKQIQIIKQKSSTLSSHHIN